MFIIICVYNCVYICNYVYYYHRDDLNKLEYVSMCIKESLRLYPPVFVTGREMSQDVTFDGHVMPKGVSNDHIPNI